ncbi:MAG: DNA-3-methyladenine glycosylase 2 family protein [Planctomycetes bacterium]|nr:DNA-3-methyladenine glycosylase 2 family protein [Planctomycetota bacterium]
MLGVTAVLNLERDELLRRFYAKDKDYNGEFVVGVVTTGIYCLPACRAKPPKPQNVRFFAHETEARGAGLRPCRRCRPDHFYRGFDPDRERVRELAAAVRAAPHEFADTGALARHAVLGATKLNELFRKHYHLTPADFLARARVERAKALLAERGSSVLEAAEASGFESASTFHENFRARTGLTPAAYRELGRTAEFTLALPAGARTSELADFFGRDPEGRTERVRGSSLTQAALLDGAPARIELELGPREARVRLVAAKKPSRSAWRAAHERVVRWFALESDPQAFERRAARAKEIARLVRGREGLRLPRSGSIFEGLVWVVVGAQVNVSFAAQCRAALIELCGTPVGEFVAHPTPAQVAALDYADLERCQFSRRKAEYLIDAARAIVAGTLELEGGRAESVPLVAERLGAVRGLGPWSVQYLLMRSYGFEDCAPIGDVALAEALKRFFALDERPDAPAATRLMETFAPQRSLATLHLWKSLGS